MNIKRPAKTPNEAHFTTNMTILARTGRFLFTGCREWCPPTADSDGSQGFPARASRIALSAGGRKRVTWPSLRRGKPRSWPHKPYDFRHAGASWRLNAGTPAPLVADWAGHTVEVLIRMQFSGRMARSRWAPPAGFEPAHTAPEAVALSPELWGLARLPDMRYRRLAEDTVPASKYLRTRRRSARINLAERIPSPG